MTEPFYVPRARADLADRCTVEVVLLVHPAGERRKGERRKTVFGRKDLVSKLGISNYLVLTPTDVQLWALGGRTGMKVKDLVGSWPRAEVRASAEGAERTAWLGSIGSSWEYRTFCLHLVGPGLDLQVDVRADAGLFTDDLEIFEQDDPVVQEDAAALREEAAATSATVYGFVRALGGWGGPDSGPATDEVSPGTTAPAR